MGETFDDERLTRARRVGVAAVVRVGAYDYGLLDLNSPRAAAELFLLVANPVACGLLPALGLGGPSARGLASSTLVRLADELLVFVEAAIGARSVFFSFPSCVSSAMGGGGLALGASLLWLASFGSNNGDVRSASPVGVLQRIAARQFAFKGRVAGVRGKCDRQSVLDSRLYAFTYRGRASKVNLEAPG